MLMLAYWRHNVWTVVRNRRPRPLFVLPHQDFSAHRMMRWFLMLHLESCHLKLIWFEGTILLSLIIYRPRPRRVSIIELQTSDVSFPLFFHLQGHCFYLNPGRIQKMRVRLWLQLTIKDVTPVPAKVKPVFTICVYNQIFETFSVVIASICSNNVNKIYCIFTHVCMCVWGLFQSGRSGLWCSTKTHKEVFFKCTNNREQMWTSWF